MQFELPGSLSTPGRSSGVGGHADPAETSQLLGRLRLRSCRYFRGLMGGTAEMRAALIVHVWRCVPFAWSVLANIRLAWRRGWARL
eukprot:7010054-Pyramimonas_sp.AAC.1